MGGKAQVICRVTTLVNPVEHERRTEPGRMEIGGEAGVAVVISKDNGNDVIIGAHPNATPAKKSEVMALSWMILTKALADDPHAGLIVKTWCHQLKEKMEELGLIKKDPQGSALN